jgi:cell division cycle 2-like protein
MGKKRDRWASSSEDEEAKPRSRPLAGRRSKEKESSLSMENGSHVSESSVSSYPLHNPLTQGCRLVYDTYDRIGHVSEGTYGVVWKARDLATDEIVALKQIKFDVDVRKEGFPVTALREINVLLALAHENIVSVREMVVGNSVEQVYMVMEFFQFDLKKGLDRFEGALSQGELKSILQQILRGLNHMHSSWYLHRDMKTSNILVHQSGRVALADFGLARSFEDPLQHLTVPVVTLWYRAPELILGETRYGPAVDMWATGCIFGELIAKECILQGEGEVDQLDQIFTLVGAPNETNWPDHTKLPHAGILRWKSGKDCTLAERFPVALPVSSKQAFLDRRGFDMLSCMLKLDPKQRISALEALEHAYFREGVSPKIPSFFVT